MTKLILFVLFPFLAHAADVPRLGLMSTAQIRDLYNSQAHTLTAASDLQPIVHAGQRAYDWINALNKNRTTPLSYSDPANATNPTMENPKIYNTALAQAMYAAIQMPAAYRLVIEGNDDFPNDPKMSDADFLALGYKVTLAYDTAVRWIMMQPYLNYYETQKIMDLRGYYFLGQLKDRDSKLQNFSSLTPTDQKLIHEWMVDLCVNDQGFASVSIAKCEGEITQTERTNGLLAYYRSKLARCKELWDSLFQLDDYAVREDITWTSTDANTLHYPFLRPTNQTILAYVQSNIEDEWKLGAWHLKLDFTTDDSSRHLSRLEYQKGVTPHMETDKIVMDDNEPLTEYMSQWTIRHEFGHLLGFKDCYVEYYDSGLKAMVNFPIDPTNLMCSRRGHLQPQHLDVLKATYYRR